MIWRLKTCNKKIGSRCLFTRQQALKMGYFYWLRVKNSNHLHLFIYLFIYLSRGIQFSRASLNGALHTGLSLDYLKDTKFYHESKASFIRISSIASFKQFLTVWLREYCIFSDSSVVSLKFSPWPKYTQYGTILQKKIMFYYPTFFLLQICSLLDCS